MFAGLREYQCDRCGCRKYAVYMSPRNGCNERIRKDFMWVKCGGSMRLKERQ